MGHYRLVDVRSSILRSSNIKWQSRSFVDTIILHTVSYPSLHTCSQEAIKKGLPSLPYHDFITDRGLVYHCNDYQSALKHITFYNSTSISIGIQNTFFQKEVLEQHLTILSLYLKILPNNILGHYELGPASLLNLDARYLSCRRQSCPHFSLSGIRSNVILRLQRRLATENLYTGPIDGDFNKQSILALQSFKPNKRGK